jgi:hypothetical protein
MPVSRCPPTSGFCKILNSMCIECNYCLKWGPHTTIWQAENIIPTVLLTMCWKKLRICSFQCTHKQNLGGFYCCGNFFDMCSMGGIGYWNTNSCPITWQTHITRCWHTPLWVCIAEWSYSQSHLDVRWSVHLLQHLQFMTEIKKKQTSSSNELPGKYF